MRNDVEAPVDAAGEVAESALAAQEERLEAAVANEEESLIETEEEMDAALRMALGDAFVGFEPSFELGIDAAEATARNHRAEAALVPGPRPAARDAQNPSPALPPGIVSVNRLYERIMLGLSAIGTQADAKRGAASELLYGRYQAETTLPNALPALVRDGPGAREDMTLNALNADLRMSGAYDQGFTPETRLQGGWRAAYHDYVKGFMLFDVPTDGRPITATLVAVPLTPMQWARSRFSDALSTVAEVGARPAASHRPTTFPTRRTSRRCSRASASSWRSTARGSPYGFDFAAAMPDVIGVVEDDAEGPGPWPRGVDRY